VTKWVHLAAFLDVNLVIVLDKLREDLEVGVQVRQLRPDINYDAVLTQLLVLVLVVLYPLLKRRFLVKRFDGCV
jgi:hypothetical protein